MPASITIPDFSGQPADFGRFERNVFEIAASADSGYEHGFHGLLMSAEQYEEFYNDKFVPFKKLSQAEEPILTENSTRADIAVASAWRERFAKHQAGEVAWKSFRSGIIVALPAGLQDSLRDGGELFTLTLTELWQRLKAKFPIDANILRFHRDQCNLVYKRGDDIEALLSRHADAHSVYKQAKSPMPGSDMVDYLINALVPCGLFTIQLAHFETHNAELEDRTYAKLAAPVRAYSRSTAFITASAQGYASANAVTSIPSSVPSVVFPTSVMLPERPTYDQLLALLANVQLAAAANTTAPVRVNELRTNNNRRRRASAGQQHIGSGGPRVHYCFTHGPQSNHTSLQCANPCSGHKERATDTNRMGGRE